MPVYEQKHTPHKTSSLMSWTILALNKKKERNTKTFTAEEKNYNRQEILGTL